MTDICERLRRWSFSPDAVPASDLMDEAAAEIERLVTVCETYAHSSAGACREIASLREAIRRLADQDATLSVCNGDVIVQMESGDQPCPYVTGATTQYCTLTPLPLTDEEREAIKFSAGSLVDDFVQHGDQFARKTAATLRSLLERTK